MVLNLSTSTNIGTESCVLMDIKTNRIAQCNTFAQVSYQVHVILFTTTIPYLLKLFQCTPVQNVIRNAEFGNLMRTSCAMCIYILICPLVSSSYVVISIGCSSFSGRIKCDQQYMWMWMCISYVRYDM